MYDRLKRNRALRKSLIVPLSLGLVSVATFVMTAVAVNVPDVFMRIDESYVAADAITSKVILGAMGGFAGIGAIILMFGPVVVAPLMFRRWWRQLCADPSASNNAQQVIKEVR